MTTTLGSADLRNLLEQPNPHEITAAAHGARLERFGLRTSVVAAAHLDPSGQSRFCPVTGEQAPEGGFARDLADLPETATELFLVAPPQADANALSALAALLPELPDSGGFFASVQVGSADDWIAAGADATRLRELESHGVRALSDGVHPRVHPALGEADRWADFWNRVAEAGLRGHAVVLYGPEHGIDSVLAQLEQIATVQKDTGVFLSIAPCIFSAKGFGGPEDHLLTQASQDIRVLAACRLLETGVEHVSLRYERSDLKSAHTALACGIDDLLGHLHLWPRDKKADVEAKDLSLGEMNRWLAEAGFDPKLRNGAFDLIGFEEMAE